MGTKPKSKPKGKWEGPSHHKNQKKGSAVAAPAAGERRGGARRGGPLTKQRDYMSRKEQPFDYFLVIDFECTCEMEDRTWPHEIIEFPAVLMDADTGEFVAEFHEYVRPVLRPTLTPFCKNLTGIQQDTVDKADTLPSVVARFVQWLVASVPEGALVCCGTDGPTDLEHFMYRMAIKRDGIRFPEVMFTYVDVKLTFCKFFKVRTKPKLHVMLKELGMKFEGQLHSGIDDTRNIARLMNAMADRGVQFTFPLQIRHRAHQVVEDSWPGPFRCPTVVPKNLMRPVDAAAAQKAEEEDADRSEEDEGGEAAATADDVEDDIVGPSGLASGDDDGITDMLDVPDRKAAAAGGVGSGDDDDEGSDGESGNSGSGDANEPSSPTADAASAAVESGSPTTQAAKKKRPAPKIIKRDLDVVRDISDRQHKRQQVLKALATTDELAVQRALAMHRTEDPRSKQQQQQQQKKGSSSWSVVGPSQAASRNRFLLLLGVLSLVNLFVALWMWSEEDGPAAAL